MITTDTRPGIVIRLSAVGLIIMMNMVAKPVIVDAAFSVAWITMKKMCPVRSARFDRHNRIAPGHVQTVEYIAAITI